MGGEAQGLEIRSVAVERREPTVMEIIQDVSRNPNLEAVAVIERLVALQERQEERQSKKLYVEAMARLQAQLPQMDKDGQAKNSKFARLESIDTIVRPLMADEGFSLSFDELEHSEKTVTFIAIMSHRGGHTESKRLTVPIDVASKNSQGNSIRPAIQDAGSTVSYARRYLIKMLLNIIEQDEDTNGEKLKKITGEEEATIKAQLDAPGMNLSKFLAYMRVEKLSDIFASDLKKAQTVIVEAQAAIAKKAAEKK